jgi:hypothetical protein
MRFHRILLLIFTLGTVLSSAWAQTGETEVPVPDSVPEEKTPGFGILGWTITPGIGVRLLSIDVASKRTGTEGFVTNDGSFSNPIYLSLDVETPTLTFGNFGATVRAHSGSLKLDHQRFPDTAGNDSASTSGGSEPSDIHDVGTEVKASYNYLMPTLFYRWAVKGGDSRLGVGYGKWDASFSGDIYMTKDHDKVDSMRTTSIDGSVEGKKGLMVFWQVRGASGLLEISFNEVEFSNSTFEFGLSELNMMYGYFFEL